MLPILIRSSLRSPVRSRVWLPASSVLRSNSSWSQAPSPDPVAIFDAIDKDSDGKINKEEFLTALEDMNFTDLLKVQEAAKTNLEALHTKLETVRRIEAHMADLEATYAEKQECVYNNIGMSTAADIDLLFAKSKDHKADIKDSLGELKALINEARDIFNSATT